jgi:hypothetical protein
MSQKKMKIADIRQKKTGHAPKAHSLSKLLIHPMDQYVLAQTEPLTYDGDEATPFRPYQATQSSSALE